jgi:hypothetical protein
VTLRAAFRSLSIIAAIALGALILHAGEPGNPRWWIGALPFALWIIGPAIAPCLIATRKSPHWFSITMLSYLVVSSTLSGFAYREAFFESQSSTAALAMVFIPLYQWLALAILVLLCFGIRRGRRSIGRRREAR